MPSDKHPGAYDFRPGTGGASTSTVIPSVQNQQTTANLGIGATINFDFTIDTGPILDMFVYADQPLDIVIFLRESASDTYQQLDNAIQASGQKNVMKQVLRALRLAASQIRVQLQNNSGVATTVVSAQVHARSV